MFSFHDLEVLFERSLHAPDLSGNITGISIDSRTLKAGDWFVALRGEKSDGHRYLKEVFLKGASGAFIEPSFLKSAEANERVFRNLMAVDDPSLALGQLASWYRSKFPIKAVGVTGSVGKTTTKEFLTYLLKKKYSVHATQGNFNNHLGLPLTLFGLKDTHAFCVAELGANHAGEIRYLGSLLKPRAAILTRVCPVHLEGFGSLEKIYEAKTEIFEPLQPGDPAVLPAEDLKLLSMARARGLQTISVGMDSNSDYRISDVYEQNGKTHFILNGKKRIQFPSRASFLAVNAGMGIAMAVSLGMTIDEIPEDWSDLVLPGGRFEEHWAGDQIKIIYDGYNANPVSFEKAVQAFSQMERKGRKMLVFSDMLELGPEAPRYHERLGEVIAESDLDFAAAYGPLSRYGIEAIHRKRPSFSAEYFEDAEGAGKALLNRLRPGDQVLLKASRGMKVEEVLNFLKINLK